MLSDCLGIHRDGRSIRGLSFECLNQPTKPFDEFGVPAIDGPRVSQPQVPHNAAYMWGDIGVRLRPASNVVLG